MAYLKPMFSSLSNHFQSTGSPFLKIVRWKGCLYTDEENVNFARHDELNRTHSEEGEEPTGTASMEFGVCDQDPDYQVPNAQGALISTWEAGWNVTNAIQVTPCSVIHYFSHSFIICSYCLCFSVVWLLPVLTQNTKQPKLSFVKGNFFIANMLGFYTCIWRRWFVMCAHIHPLLSLLSGSPHCGGLLCNPTHVYSEVLLRAVEFIPRNYVFIG